MASGLYQGSSSALPPSSSPAARGQLKRTRSACAPDATSDAFLPDRVPDDVQTSSDDDPPAHVLKRVSRHERTFLLQVFRREQRFARRVFLRELRSHWDRDVKDSLVEMGTNSPFYPSEAEVEAEAWENYSFDRTIQFEGDQAEQLVHFRSSLYVMPPSQDPPDPAFARARTVRVNAL